MAGAAISSLQEYNRFLETAYGSAKEVEYQLLIAERLVYGQSDTIHAISDQASETAKVRPGLIRALRDTSRLRLFYLMPIVSSLSPAVAGGEKIAAKDRIGKQWRCVRTRMPCLVWRECHETGILNR